MYVYENSKRKQNASAKRSRKSRRETMAKTVVATAPGGSRRVFKNIQAAAEFLADSVEPGANVSKYTELYLGLTPGEADDVVQKCAKDLETGDDRAFQMRMKEIELEMKAEERRIKAEERQMKEVEANRDIRLAEIDLEKLKLQSQLA